MTGAAVPAISVRIRYATKAAMAELVAAADDLGLHGAWVSEPWGFDAGAVLGWAAGATRRVVLGTHIASVFARTPVATAGVAASLATLSDGRFRLGLGTSGPQVVEGWHGVPFERPLERTRDTVAIVRAALTGEPVVHAGRSVTVPSRPDRRPLRFSQLGEPLDVPIYLAALGPANQRLAAEVADGWTPTPYSPDAHDTFAAPLTAALAEHDRVGAVRIAPVCPVAIGPRLPDLLDLERGWSALYLGGMGLPGQSFYAESARRLGHAAMADAVQTRWTAGDRRGARAAVSDAYADSIGLFGTVERVRERLDRYVAAGVDEIVVELRKPDVTDQVEDLRLLWKAVHG
jgi:F420-dependent oxidoreductase-like protein